MTPTPRTDKHMRGGSYSFDVDFARQLERDIATLNDRLIGRQQTLMFQAVKLQNAERLLTRCRDSAGRMEMGLYEDIQSYLHGEQ